MYVSLIVRDDLWWHGFSVLLHESAKQKLGIKPANYEAVLIAVFGEYDTYLVVNREHLVRFSVVSLALGAVCACVSHSLLDVKMRDLLFRSFNGV